jgi:hypothetical protein
MSRGAPGNPEARGLKEPGGMEQSRTSKLLQLFMEFMETSRNLFDEIWDVKLGALYATPPRFPYVTFGQAFLLRADLALAQELSQSTSGDVSVSNLALWTANLFGVFGLALFRSPLATVALENQVLRVQVKLWPTRRNTDMVGEYARRVNAALLVSSGAGRRDLIHAGGGVRPEYATTFAESMWPNAHYSLYRAPPAVILGKAPRGVPVPVQVVALSDQRKALVAETCEGAIVIGDKTGGISRGNFFDVTSSRSSGKACRFMQKVHPRRARSLDAGATGLGATESFAGSALLQGLCQMAWPAGLDFLVRRLLDVLGYGSRAIMGAAWHVPGGLRILVELTEGFTEFERLPAATAAGIPRLLVRLGVASAIPLWLGFGDVGKQNQGNWGEVVTGGKTRLQFIDLFQNVQANQYGVLYVRQQIFEAWSGEDFRAKLNGHLCELAALAKCKGPAAWAALEAAASSLSELQRLTGEDDEQVLEACAEFLVSDPAKRKTEKLIALALAEICGRLRLLEPPELLVLNQPSDSLGRLFELADVSAPPSASANALPVRFGRAARDPAVPSLVGLGGRRLADFLAETPALPGLVVRGGTAANVATQLRHLGGVEVLGRESRPSEPEAAEKLLAFATKFDTALSTLCAEFLALTADEGRQVSIGGELVTLREAGWIDSWVPVRGEDPNNNAEFARRVLASYRERTWQATWWLLWLAKQLGVVFE